MEHYIKYLNDFYFSPLLLFVIAAGALIVSIKMKKQQNVLRFVPIYISLCILQIIFFFIGLIEYADASGLLFYVLNNYVIAIFVLFETLMFIFFFNRISPKPVAWINFICLSIIICTVVANLSNNISNQELRLLCLMQSVLIMPQCILYYRCILKSELTTKLSHEPTFWIANGISLVTIGTVPLALFQDYLTSTEFRQAQVLSNLFYCAFFIMIIKAHLCNKQSAIINN